MDKGKHVEVHDHAGNKVMIPWEEANRIHHEMMDEEQNFDPHHYLKKAQKNLQDVDVEHEFPDTEEKLKEGLQRNLGLDYCEAEYLGEAIEAFISWYFCKAEKK